MPRIYGVCACRFKKLGICVLTTSFYNTTSSHDDMVAFQLCTMNSITPKMVMSDLEARVRFIQLALSHAVLLIVQHHDRAMRHADA